MWMFRSDAFRMILPKIEKGDWKRILFVPTGALLSTVSFNEGQTVPGMLMRS